SHPVHARVRGATWTRRELALQALGMQALAALPMILGFSGFFALLGGRGQAAVLWFAAASGSFFLGLYWLMKGQGSQMRALMTGVLRHRVFALAAKAGVSIKQILIQSAAKSQEANAAAVHGNVVLLTDYLLENLSEREVDAVVAHELVHLKLRHTHSLI